MLAGEVTGDIESLLETTTYLSKRTAREQSEDSIQKQLGAFERLLQHAMSRFSKENLYHVLRHVTKWKEENLKPAHKHATKVQYKLRSVAQLKDITKEMRSDKTKKKSPEDERIMKNYELFLNDLLYLRDLKKYFDDEIYKALLKYHYDSGIVKSGASDKGSKYALQQGRYQQMDDDESGHVSPPGGPGEKATREEANTQTRASNSPADKEAEEKYRQTVNDLKSILDKWERLLSEDIPDLNAYDPDSYHELMQFTNYSQFETLLRLVPDIFAKCYKCIELAKTWLEQSNIVLHDIPLKVSPPPESAGKAKETQTDEDNEKTTKEILKNIRDLQSQIHSIDTTMDDDEAALEKYNQEMDNLVGREERVITVESEVQQLDSMMTRAAGDYQKSVAEQNAVANKLKGCAKGSRAYAETKTDLKRLDSEVLQNHHKMKLLEFGKITKQEDYLVELELRPEFIRFIGDTQEKMQDLERFLTVKKEEKVKLEKQLALAKTNTERMKKIMNAYLGDNDKAKTENRGSPHSKSDSDVTSIDGNDAGRSTGTDSPLSDETKSISSRKSSRPSTGESVESTILQKPKLVKKGRDFRPPSEASQKEADAKPKTPNVLSVNKMPKASLKTSPRRVWENF